MRIRSIKPEFYRSDDIDRLDWHDRFVFIGLWSYVDDNGVGYDKLSAICADLFAGDMERDPRETLARVSKALENFAADGLITRYQGPDGKRYLHVSGWKHQRVDKPNKPRYPLPTSENVVISEPIATPSRDSRDIPAPGTGEQRNRGTDKRTPRPPVNETTSLALVPAKAGGGQQIAERLNATARSVAAHEIAVAFSNSLPAPLESGVLTKVGVEVDKCLKAGIPPPAIAEGLQAWTDSDSFSPTQIPNFVHKAASSGNRASRRQGGRGKPTDRALDAMQIAENLISEGATHD